MTFPKLPWKVRLFTPNFKFLSFCRPQEAENRCLDSNMTTGNSLSAILM